MGMGDPLLFQPFWGGKLDPSCKIKLDLTLLLPLADSGLQTSQKTQSCFQKKLCRGTAEPASRCSVEALLDTINTAYYLLALLATPNALTDSNTGQNSTQGHLLTG